MDELYVVARRVLLDALTALGAHRDAVVLVGAQAIYLRVGEADLAVAPYTTDGDLAIDPSILAEVPPLEEALGAAGFFPKTKDSVGIWITHRETSHDPKTEVAVDLLVPASISPGQGRRAARLTGHDTRAARIVKGLEGAVVDADVLTIAALEENDQRRLDLRVAGVGALLVAKLHKLHERKETARQSDKDALDILRLLRGVSTAELVRRTRTVAGDPRSSAVCGEAIDFLRAQFGSRNGQGSQMAARATAGLADAAEIALSCEILASDLLRALGR